LGAVAVTTTNGGVATRACRRIVIAIGCDLVAKGPVLSGIGGGIIVVVIASAIVARATSYSQQGAK